MHLLHISIRQALWSYSDTIDRTELTKICQTVQELVKLLEPVTASAHSGTERDSNHEHRDYRVSVQMNSDSPSSLWSWQAETMHFRTSVQLNTNNLHYSIICNTGRGTKDTWLLLAPKYEMRLLVYYLSFKTKRQGCQSPCNQTLKLTAFDTGIVYKLKTVKGDHSICRVMLCSGKCGNVQVKFTL